MKVEGENKQYSRELNEQYNDIKRRLDQTNDEIKKIQQEIKDKMSEKTILLGKIAEAKRAGNMVAEKDAQSKLNVIEKRLQELDKMDKKQKERLVVIKDALNKKMDEKNGNTPSQDFGEVDDQYLEEVNAQYMDIKRRLKQADVELTKIEQAVEDKMSDRTILLGKIAEAKRAGDKTAEKDAQTKLTAIERDLKKLNAKAKDQKARLAVIQAELDKKIDEKIRNIPGMKEHLNEIIRKQSARKLPSIDEKLQPLLKAKSKLEQIIILTSTHPTIENYLKGYLGAAKKYEELTAEIDALRDGVDDKGVPKFKDPKRAGYILNKLLQPLKINRDKNKASLLAYFKKNEISIEEADIDALVNGKVIIDNKGIVDLKTTFAARKGSLDRQIKGLENSKAKLARTNQNVQGIIPDSKPVPEPTPEPEPEPQPGRDDYGYGEPEQKPKAWQFIKRFKMWLARRQQKRLEEEYENDYEEPDEGEDAPSIDEEQTVATAREHTEFRNSLKYEILRDAVDREMKEQLKKAKEQGRNNPEGR